MKQVKPVFVCQECGVQRPKWQGKCDDCGAWSSFVEERPFEGVLGGPTTHRYAMPGIATPGAKKYAEIEATKADRISTGINEFDRVLGGGIVPGSLVLLGGEPGIGKSTLLLQAAANFANTVGPVLYASGEESEHQIKSRGERLGVGAGPLFLLSETCLERILEEIDRLKPSLVIIDSIQTVFSLKLPSAPGSVGQVRQAATELLFAAKGKNIPIMLVGHVTKDGSIAGPRVLEHLVDVVLHFEGESGSRFRMVRAVKNRFGPVDEVGCFDLGPDGITAVTDPTGIFVERHHGRVAGTCVAVSMEGRRPLLAEVQSLVAHTSGERPRRTTSGVDGSRLAMVLAVLQQHCGITLGGHDVFASTVGGARIIEPAADLALAIALASSHYLTPTPAGVVAMGEIGLSGELRRVRDVRQRLAEAARLGFELAVVPAEPGSPGTYRSVDDMRVVEAPDVRTALRLMHLDRSLKVVEGG